MDDALFLSGERPDRMYGSHLKASAYNKEKADNGEK